MQASTYVVRFVALFLAVVGTIGFLYGALGASRNTRPIWDMAPYIPIMLQAALAIGLSCLLYLFSSRDTAG